MNEADKMMKMNQGILGLDIGGTYIRAGVVDRENRLHDFEMESSACLFEDGAEEMVALAEYVQQYCSRHLLGSLPEAVSIGFPSTLNKDKTVLLSTPNLPGFDNTPVVEILGGKLGIPVYINRDVNLLLVNDMHAHGLENGGIVIGCYIGTGLGNAICIEGEFLSGKNGVAGELGHVPVLGGTRICGCGNTGCMETIASGRYLEEIMERHFSGDSVKEAFTSHSNHPIIKEYIKNLAVPVAAEINLLDPDYVVLGGGVLQMPGFPMDFFMEMIGDRVRKPQPYEGLQIIISSQNQRSGVIGAGMYAYRQLRKERKYDSHCIRSHRARA